MQEDQDTCRICSAPAEPDQPLFHPCKCSGTIRYIHQDCLTTWLNHSKKKTCDVCKHPYAFTKVYAKDMPQRLPPLLVLRQFARQSLLTMLFVLRCVLVGVVWLALLPWVTVWTWRMYFTMGDSTAWWISDRPRPISTGGFSFLAFNRNATGDDMDFAPANATLVHRITAHPVWRTVSADIFAGQIIASLIVLIFVAIFLLREWIVQNARPGVFEELEAPPPPDMEDVPPELAEPPPMPVPHDDADALDTDTDTDSVSSRSSRDSREAVQHSASSSSLSSGESSDSGSTNSNGRAPKRRRLDDPQDDYAQRRARMYRAAMLRRYAVDENAPANEPLALPLEPEPRPPFHTRYGRRSSSEPRTIGSSPSLLDAAARAEHHRRQDASSASASSSSHSQRESLPTPRRPPLPCSGPASRVNTPLASPGLATYRPPEDLLPGQSGYFDEEAVDADEVAAMAAEHARFFRDPADGDHERERFFDEREAGSEHGDDEAEAGSMSGGETEDEFGDLDMTDSLPSLESLVSDDDDDEELDEGERRHRMDEGGEGRLGDGADNADAPLQPNPAALLDGNGQFDILVEDENDMEGILEVIGLRGPILGVLQNAALVIFVLDTVIGLGIWVPYTIGKSTALLTLDPPRLLRVINFPIRVMRTFTDPVIDSVLYLVGRLVLPVVVSALSMVVQVCCRALVAVVGSVFGEDAALEALEMSLDLYDALEVRWNEAVTLLTAPAEKPTVPIVEVSTTFVDGLFESNTWLARWSEPYFAILGKHVRVAGTSLVSLWSKAALGTGTVEKIFAICLGYLVIGFLIAVYLNILTTGNVRSAGRAIRRTVRQQLLIVKVGAFILFELAIFPAGCGVIMDGASLWLFDSTVDSRWVFFQKRPLTATFYHWLAGTVFMYHFSIVLAGARTILRPGVLYFIKDPSDVNFHPLRDILERPTLTHLRKLFYSGMMYLIIIVAIIRSVGTMIWATISPFYWKPRDNLSSVPIDLLMLQFLLPYTMHYFRPSKPLRRAFTAFWRVLAAKLRLSDVLFGSRVPEEGFTPARSIWTLLQGSQTADGGYFRVPATDHVALTPDIRGTAKVDEHGVPLTPAEDALIRLQNTEAERANRNVKQDYQVVYVPPQARIRLLLFLLASWLAGSVAIAVAIVLPIATGRQAFKLFTPRDIHDGYSALVGFYLISGCCMVGRALDHLDKRRQRFFSDDEGNVAAWGVYVFKRFLLWAPQVAWLVIWFGFILPTLLALVVEVYLILPIRFGMNPEFVPRIRIVDMWALGLIYARICLRTHPVHASRTFGVGLERLVRNGWTNPDAVSATIEVIGPLLIGLGAMLMLPISVVWFMRTYLQMPIDNKFLLVHVFPGIFASAGFFRMLGSMSGIFSSWSEAIRDKEYVVSVELRNLDAGDARRVVVKREDETLSLDGTENE